MKKILLSALLLISSVVGFAQQQAQKLVQLQVLDQNESIQGHFKLYIIAAVDGSSTNFQQLNAKLQLLDVVVKESADYSNPRRMYQLSIKNNFNLKNCKSVLEAFKSSGFQLINIPEN